MEQSCWTLPGELGSWGAGAVPTRAFYSFKTGPRTHPAPGLRGRQLRRLEAIEGVLGWGWGGASKEHGEGLVLRQEGLGGIRVGRGQEGRKRRSWGTGRCKA